jgi:uncharacterized protein
MQKIIQQFFILILTAYRGFISPLLGPNCRFTPSCSRYALEAIQKQGTVRGLYLTFKRLSRCHPGGKAGYDPVPNLKK